MLPEPTQTALVEIVRNFDSAGISYCVGGSAMLALSGIDVTIGDIDLVVEADSRRVVEMLLADRDVEEPGSTEPWRSEWFVRTRWPVGAEAVSVDIVGGLAVMIDGELARFPCNRGSRVEVAGIEVSLGSLAHWYHLYRVHDPRKAALIAGCLSDTQIMDAALELGISHIFSPTLIVRIGIAAAPTGLNKT